ncbi:MAG: hypothetical protein HPY71_10475 [Firmicutes bacterium]|nr:hypothetical protein [Bacillota bacterium]
MTPKERLLRALNREKPDRLPATVHSWMTYYLNHYLGGVDQFEAYRRFGLDPVIYYTKFKEAPVGPSLELLFFELFEGPNWHVAYQMIRQEGDITEYAFEIETPGGKLTKKMATNQYTAWVTEYPIKELEQIEIVRKYMPVPELDKEAINAVYDKLGDDGILRSYVAGNQPGIWQDACTMVGTQEMIFHAIDNPGWVHEFLRILLERKLAFVESMKGVKYDLIENGGGDASSTVISPKMFEEFCLPYDRQVHKALHDLGFKVTYHTCGGMMPILEKIVANGCDASETLSPPDMGGDVDLREVKRRIGDKVCLIGGMDQYNILGRGTPEMVRAAVRKCFEEAGPGGGYIMMPCDHFFHAPVENIQAYADAARECEY